MSRILPRSASVLAGGTLAVLLTSCQGSSVTSVPTSAQLTGAQSASAGGLLHVTGAPTTGASGTAGTLESGATTASARIVQALSTAAAKVVPAATTRLATAAAPAANQQANNQGGADAAGARTGGEGGATGAEGAAAGPSITNPGGLPASPPTNDPTINQMGQEQYVLYRDPQNRYQVSFVSTWQRQNGTTADSVVSRQGDRTVNVALPPTSSRTASALAQAEAAHLKASLSGYQQLALRPGTIPYGPVTSLIYRFTQGANPVTGKGNAYIAARVYIPRSGSTTDMAVVTVSAPAAFYGDLTQIFDPVVASFRWR